METTSERKEITPMNIKRKIVRLFVDFTDGWNKELHGAIEANVFAEYKNLFKENIGNQEETKEIIERMREFYYARMVNTSVLLLGILSCSIAIFSLLISVFALFHK
jgi:hypothetical protein